MGFFFPIFDLSISCCEARESKRGRKKNRRFSRVRILPSARSWRGLDGAPAGCRRCRWRAARLEAIKPKSDPLGPGRVPQGVLLQRHHSQQQRGTPAMTYGAAAPPRWRAACSTVSAAPSRAFFFSWSIVIIPAATQSVCVCVCVWEWT